MIARLRAQARATWRARRLFLQAGAGHPRRRPASNAQYQFTLLADSTDRTLQVGAEAHCRRCRTRPELADVNSDQQQGGLESDRDDRPRDRRAPRHRAERRSTTRCTTRSASARCRPSTTPLNQYHVVMEVAPQYWQSPDMLKQIYVSTSGGSASGSADDQCAGRHGTSPCNAGSTSRDARHRRTTTRGRSPRTRRATWRSIRSRRAASRALRRARRSAPRRRP